MSTAFLPNADSLKRWASGGALFDFDNDEGLGSLPCSRQCAFFHNGTATQKSALSKTMLVCFVDITATANVGDTGYGLGAVAADYNSDGVPRPIRNELREKMCFTRNNGDGTFTDVNRSGTGRLSAAEARVPHSRILTETGIWISMSATTSNMHSKPTSLAITRNTLRNLLRVPTNTTASPMCCIAIMATAHLQILLKSAGVYEPTTRRGLGVRPLRTLITTDGRTSTSQTICLRIRFSINQGDGIFSRGGCTSRCRLQR